MPEQTSKPSEEVTSSSDSQPAKVDQQAVKALTNQGMSRAEAVAVVTGERDKAQKRAEQKAEKPKG